MILNDAASPTVSRRGFLAAGLSSLFVPALARCQSASAPTTTFGSPRLESRPGTPNLSASPGLSELGLEGGRDGLLYVPPGLDPGVPAPLLVVLHGATGSSEGWEALIPTADARGFVFLVPESRGTTWDAIRTTFDVDVDFIDRALSHTFSRVSIEPARVAVSGFSDGATYALSLGVANGDLFRYVIGWSPGFMVPVRRVEKPPVFVSHGTQDNILPVGQSRDRIVPALRDDDYDVTYVEFEGGHVLPSDIVTQTLDWFLG